MGQNALWPILALWIFIEQIAGQCSKQDYQRCVRLADPLLKDPHLIYPDNPRDIERVCRTWTYFVECVKMYTDRCFTESRRQEFNKAVESPVSSIHRLCSSPDYRAEYMKHAGCMKMMLTEEKHCGRHYRLLVNQVGGEAPQASICCSHHMFRECVVDQTKSSCNAEAAPFSGQMLDKALSFLRDQCSNFIPNQLDCPGLEFYKGTSFSQQQGRSEEGRGTEGGTTKMKAQATTSMSSGMTPAPDLPRSSQPLSESTRVTSPWAMSTETRGSSSSPSSSSTKTGTDWSGGSSAAWTPAVSTEAETSRSSYARGIMYSMSTSTEVPVSTWKVSGTYQNTWLPSARPIDNAIDEPNQAGLGSSGLENSTVQLASSSSVLLFLVLLLTFLR